MIFNFTERQHSKLYLALYLRSPRLSVRHTLVGLLSRRTKLYDHLSSLTEIQGLLLLPDQVHYEIRKGSLLATALNDT